MIESLSPATSILDHVSVEDELRSLTAGGIMLLCSLVLRQQILVYLLPDGSRVGVIF